MSASFDDYALVAVLYCILYLFFFISLSLHFRVEFSLVLPVKDEQAERHDDDDHQFKND